MLRASASLPRRLAAHGLERGRTRSPCRASRVRRKYLEIEQTRFHDRLKVHMDVPPDLLAVYVPSLALQPLVEMPSSTASASIPPQPARDRANATRQSLACVRDDARDRHRDRACDSASDSPMSSHLETVYGTSARWSLPGQRSAVSHHHHSTASSHEDASLIVDDEPIARRVSVAICRIRRIKCASGRNGISGWSRSMNFIPTSFSRCADA